MGFSFFNVFCFVLLGLDLDQLGIDDFEVEDEVGPDFPCLYCYESLSVWGSEKNGGGEGLEGLGLVWLCVVWVRLRE